MPCSTSAHRSSPAVRQRAAKSLLSKRVARRRRGAGAGEGAGEGEGMVARAGTAGMAVDGVYSHLSSRRVRVEARRCPSLRRRFEARYMHIL